jgi:hypothetical protein
MRRVADTKRHSCSRRPLGRQRTRGLVSPSSVVAPEPEAPQLATRLPFDATNTASFNAGDWGAIATGQGRTIDFHWDPYDDALSTEPNEAGVVVSQWASNVGWFLDTSVAADPGQARFIVRSAGAVLEVKRFALPGAGGARITISVLNNGSDSFTFKIYVNRRLIPAGELTATFTGGLASGETDIMFGGTTDGDICSIGSVARARHYLTELTPAEVVTVYANGRLQDSAGPDPDADIWFGSGTGDTLTAFVDQSGNGNDCSVTGAMTAEYWLPPRRVGIRDSFSGTSAATWTASPNMTLSTGTNGVRLTTTADDGTLATYARRNKPNGSCHYRMRALVQVDTAEQAIIWIGRVPMRTGAGVALGVINLLSGAKVSTINIGDDVDFNNFTEIARSDTSGTVPTDAGGNTMPDTGVTNGDQYELIYEQFGDLCFFQVRNFTQGLEPVRLTALADNEAPDGTTHAMPSPGYPAVGSILNNSTVEVVEFEYEDLTVYQPEWLALTDSQVNVDDGGYENSLFFVMNELREPDADLRTKWIAEWGSPGSRVQDLTDCDVLTGDIEAIAPRRVAIMCGPNSYGANGAAATEVDLGELQTQILTWSTLPLEILHVAHPVLTAGAVTSGAWRTNQATVAALTVLGTTSDAGWEATGDPTGTDNQEATYFKDAVHTNTAGKLAWATAEHNSGNWDA